MHFKLPDLEVGDRCYVQNQTGNYPKRWDRSGTIVEHFDHDSYAVKVDGTGRVTRRNRRFLRKFIPVTPTIQRLPQHPYNVQQPPYNAQQPIPTMSPSAYKQPRLLNPTPTTQPALEDTRYDDNSCDIPHTERQHDDIPPPQAEHPEQTVTMAPNVHHPTATDATSPCPANLANKTLHRSPSTEATRPRRQRRSPSRYEPETGTWINK